MFFKNLHILGDDVFSNLRSYLDQPDSPGNTVGQIYMLHLNAANYKVVNACLACERRRISSGRFSPPKSNVCEFELQNDFCDVNLLLGF